MTTFHLPDVGEGLGEAEIVTWHVGVGDHVVADQPLVSIETDKAVVEIPSPRSGHIAALYGDAGDVIDVGTALVDFADGAAPDTGAIVGDLPSSDTQATARDTGAIVGDAPGSDTRATAPEPARTRAATSVRAAPAVRALAAALQVDLGALTPTGTGGTITRADVESAAEATAATADASIEPLRGVRRAMEANMTRAHAVVVPATVTAEADIADWPSGTDTTMRLLRAIARACAAEPALNASYLGRTRGRRLHTRVDVGVAVDTEDGLFVPVLRDVATRPDEDLRRGLDAMRSDIATRTVPPEHLRGATISLSNFGALGGLHAALVVVPPQVAIIGAGRARDAVVPYRGEIAIRRLLPLSLTFDHRVVMGGEATRFITALIADLETPT